MFELLLIAQIESVPLCYYQTDMGTIVDLTALCGRSSAVPAAPSVPAATPLDGAEPEDPRVTRAREILRDPNASDRLKFLARDALFWNDQIMPSMRRLRDFSPLIPN